MFKLSSIIVAWCVFASVLAIKSPHGANFSTKCDVCHNADSWAYKGSAGTFDHNTTRFPLVGQHAMVDCKLCHTDLVFSNAKQSCMACHKDVHQQTVGTDCSRCHTPRSWTVNNISQIHQQSRFPLHGAHVQADCYQCHTSSSRLRFDPIGTECVDCHLAGFNSTTNPSHTQSHFPKDCMLCHNDNAWKGATFDHNTNTTFPLRGSHVGIGCSSCHTKGYAGTDKQCVSCHLKDYNATTNPGHASANFSKECQTCHTENSWAPSTFNHNTSTTFPLKGGHIGVDCIKCHSAGFVGTDKQCVSCHLKDYNATTNPGHASANFSKECQTCHTENSWVPSTFNHNTSTTFPLKGGHIGVDCIKCHSAGYVGTDKQCVSCHLKDYNATTNPGHASANFSKECQTCHTENSWTPSTFNHNTSTTFPLKGGHIAVDCIKCHSAGYAGTDKQCVSCHLKDYNATTNPGHASANFSKECQTCHTENSWAPSTFNHNTSTTFPLKGGHIGVDCIKCHSAGFVGTDKQCVSCHLKDYNAATNPNHINAKFSTECVTCHTENAWVPSTFDHNKNTSFPLTGGHVGVDCIKCHASGYANTSTKCESCHMADYNATTNPRHLSAKFPTDCASCHKVTAWAPSTFNHDAQYFPIYSGKHRGQWTLCTECHTNPSNFGTFSCIVCHQHSNKTTVNSQHRGVSGYVYNGTSCYTCHPQGRN